MAASNPNIGTSPEIKNQRKNELPLIRPTIPPANAKPRAIATYPMPCMGYASPEDGLERPEDGHHDRDDYDAPEHRCDDAGGELDRDHCPDHEDQSGNDLAHDGRPGLALLNVGCSLHG